MGRPRKQNREPFWRSVRNCWYVHVGTRQYRLSPDKDEAWRLWHEMMARPPEERKPIPSGPSALVVELLDAFLEWTKNNQAPKTYRWHRDNIQNFVSEIPPTMTVAELKPYHVTRVMDAKDTWSNSTKNGFARSVQRGMKWAEKQGLIERTPIPQVEKPGRESREVVITPEEFDDLLARFPDQEFGDVLITCWETGCRPQEMMRVEARHVDLTNARWVFRLKESKGKKFTRIVYLTERAAEITRRLVSEHPTGPLFRNADGEPWDKNAINRRFHRKKKALGRKLCLYHIRHSFATRMLLAGVDALIPSKSTAFGRVTRRASSDPACFLPETSSAWRAWGVSPETPLPSRVEWPESR
jgi:integrase